MILVVQPSPETVVLPFEKSIATWISVAPVSDPAIVGVKLVSLSDPALAMYQEPTPAPVLRSQLLHCAATSTQVPQFEKSVSPARLKVPVVKVSGNGGVPSNNEIASTSVAVEVGPSRVGPALATLGAGVLLGSALAFDLVGDSTYAQAKANHDVTKWNAANDDRYTAEGLLVAGVGCTAVAVYLWLENHGERPARVAPARTIVSPVARSGYAGLQLDGRW